MAADAIEEGRLRNVNVGLLGHVDSGYGSVWRGRSVGGRCGRCGRCGRSVWGEWGEWGEWGSVE